jgi:hypothetical protein
MACFESALLESCHRADALCRRASALPAVDSRDTSRMMPPAAQLPPNEVEIAPSAAAKTARAEAPLSTRPTGGHTSRVGRTSTEAALTHISDRLPLIDERWWMAALALVCALEDVLASISTSGRTPPLPAAHRVNMACVWMMAHGCHITRVQRRRHGRGLDLRAGRARLGDHFEALAAARKVGQYRRGALLWRIVLCAPAVAE